MRKVKKAKWLVIALTVFMLLSLIPAVGGAENDDPVPNYGFIPNSGEASVSKVDLVNFEEVARYYTAERNDPDPYDWRTSRIAMDDDGNAWVLNVGADGTGLQGAVVRIQADTEGLANTHEYPDPVLDFGDDDAVQVLDVGEIDEMPRAIAIDDDGYIWVGFYGSGRLVQYEYDPGVPTLNNVDEWTNEGIGFYEMKFAPDGTLFISSRQSTSSVARPGIVTGIYTFDSGTFDHETTWNPYSILIAADGTVYATAYNSLLYIRDTVTEWSSVDITGSSQNRGMAFDNEGNIWIASTVNHNAGTTVYSYDIAGEAPGLTYTLTSGGTTPVGVGKDAAGNMWAILRSDALAQGWIEGFDPSDQEKVGEIEVGHRPYAYGDFVVPEPPKGCIDGYKAITVNLAVYLDEVGYDPPLAGWEIKLHEWDENENNGALGDYITSVHTDEYGYFEFCDLDPGTYAVRENVLGGTVQIDPVNPNYHVVEVVADDTTRVKVADPITEGVWDESEEEYAFLNDFAEFAGCTPGYWRQPAFRNEVWTDDDDYGPTDLVTEVFDLAVTGENGLRGGNYRNWDTKTLYDGLSGGGGPGVEGAQKILIRAAIASLLNAQHDLIPFPYTTDEVIEAVNDALATGDPDQILELAEYFDELNNEGCILNAFGEVYEDD